MKFKVYMGLLHQLIESLRYTCLGNFVVVSSISLKPISLHRCLAEGLWIASLDFHFIFNLCKCNQLETVEHYLLHCERYFNEREALRTHIFNTTGTPDLSCKFLLSCTKNDFRKIHEMNIFSELGDFITRTARF